MCRYYYFIISGVKSGTYLSHFTETQTNLIGITARKNFSVRRVVYRNIACWGAYHAHCTWMKYCFISEQQSSSENAG